MTDLPYEVQLVEEAKARLREKGEFWLGTYQRADDDEPLSRFYHVLDLVDEIHRATGLAMETANDIFKRSREMAAKLDHGDEGGGDMLGFLREYVNEPD